jgi:hypothetical protein
MSVGSRFVRNIDSPTWKRLRKFAVGRNRTMGSVFTELMTRFLPVLEQESEQCMNEGKELWATYIGITTGTGQNIGQFNADLLSAVP